MSFSAKQVRALKRRVDPSHVRLRQTQGRELAYIEGWYAIAEANRIFGFDGWDRETIEAKCLLAREVRGSFHVAYVCKVRLTVRTNGVTIIREGHGTGEGKGALPGETHEFALKQAETDATKRALATFGKSFGLALYANGKGNGAANASKLSEAKSPEAKPPEPKPPEAKPLVAKPPVASRAASADGLEHIRRFERQYAAPGGQAQGRAMVPQATRSAQGNEGRAASSAPNIEASEQARREPRPAPQNGAPLNGAPARTDAGSPEPSANDTGIDKSVMPIAQDVRRRDRSHLKFVAMQPCLICERAPSDPHHLQFAQPRALGRKVSDEFTVPLCRIHHRQLHRYGKETEWWTRAGIDALDQAQRLWRASRRMSDADSSKETTH